MNNPTPPLAQKHDDGKPRLDYLDPYVMEEVAKVLTFGATKYAPWNWKKGIEIGRLTAACLRHIFAFMRGENTDPETGLSHLAHAICCLMFALWMIENRRDMDDRSSNEPKVTEPKITVDFVPGVAVCTPPPTGPFAISLRPGDINYGGVDSQGRRIKDG